MFQVSNRFKAVFFISVPCKGQQAFGIGGVNIQLFAYRSVSGYVFLLKM